MLGLINWAKYGVKRGTNVIGSIIRNYKLSLSCRIPYAYGTVSYLYTTRVVIYVRIESSVLCVLHTKTHTNFKPASIVPLLSLLLFSIVPHFAFRFCNAHSSQRSLVSCAMMLFHFIVARFVVLCRFSYRVWSCTAVWDLVPLGISYSALILDTQRAHEGMKTPSSNKRQQLKRL